MDIADKIYEEKAGRPEHFRCTRCGKTAKRYMQIWRTSRDERLTCMDCLRELHPSNSCEGRNAPYPQRDREKQERMVQRRLGDFG